MIPGSRGEQRDLHNPTLRAIADSGRREFLDLLLTDGPLHGTALAHRITTPDRRPHPSTDRGTTTLAKLAHNHLPVLRAAGLIAWDPEREIVDTTDHPALTDPRFVRLLRTDAVGMDAVLSGLAHEIRRIALTELWSGPKVTTRTALASDVRDCLKREAALGAGSLESIEIALHHAHLPRLADDGFIEYEAGTERVVYADHPLLDEVLRVIYCPDESVLDKYDGFLSGLRASYPDVGTVEDHSTVWPHAWREPYRG